MKRSVLIKKARVSPALKIDNDYVIQVAAEVLPKRRTEQVGNFFHLALNFLRKCYLTKCCAFLVFAFMMSIFGITISFAR